MNYYNCENGFNIKKILVIASVFLLVCYGFLNARNLILGPTIKILSPEANSETSENILAIKGKIDNASFISLNEKQIFVDKEGFFEERLLLSPGSNIIEVKARDRFKKEVSQTLNVYYKQDILVLNQMEKINSN